MSKGKGSPAAEICRKTAIGCGKGEPESLYASYEFWKEAGGVTGAATHSKQHGEAADRCAGDPVGAEPCGAVCRAVLRAAEAPGNGIQTAAQAAGAPVPTAARAGKVTIRLYDRSPEYNREFSVTNMFPGDAETQNDCVQVDHKGDVTVHFRAEVRPGYEKLAEVLKLRVSVGGSVLYDGLMAETPAAVDTLLPAGSDTLDYQLTAYLDTSVGNPYMYQQLVADFYWWVADSEELAPTTGDTMQPLLWGAAVLVSGAALTVLLRRRREVSHD